MLFLLKKTKNTEVLKMLGIYFHFQKYWLLWEIGWRLPWDGTQSPHFTWIISCTYLCYLPVHDTPWTCYHQSFRGLWKRDSLSNIPLVPTFAVLPLILYFQKKTYKSTSFQPTAHFNGISLVFHAPFLLVITWFPCLLEA